jgi:hypothetical protein
LARVTKIHEYIHGTLLPRLEPELIEITPINEDFNVVVLPNEIIVAEYGQMYGSQFTVEDIPESGAKHIQVATYGLLLILRDGKLCYDAQFRGTLGHTEGDEMIKGKIFAPDSEAGVQEAVQFIKETNRKVNHQLTTTQQKNRPSYTS